MDWELTRRNFLQSAAAAGISLASPAWRVVEAFAQTCAANLREVDREFYVRLAGRRVQCHICPLHCQLNPGDTCFCRTRRNHEGRLLSHAYGNPCILSVDPIEKLPLNHFMPEEKTLSIAVGGCNLRCLYCQNWRESQARPDDLKNLDLPVEKAIRGVESRKLRILAYTYTEPVAFLEYAEDLAAAARENGVKNVCATALSINEKPLRRFCRNIDAFAVALKGFDEKFYDRVLGAALQPVLQALEVVKDEKVWLEVVTLIVPTYNDDLKKIRQMCRWIRKNLGPDVPLHFGRFVPQFRLKDLPRTPTKTLEACRDTALDAGLRYVYIFNVSPHEGNNTYCAGCRKPIIERLGFKVLRKRMKGDRCGHCGRKIPGVWTG